MPPAAPGRAIAYAPGSTSNLGPGFDCLGVAFTGKGDRVRAEVVPSPGVRVVSVSDPRIPTDPARNTAAIAAAWVLRRAGAEVGLDLTVEKGLPLSGGMGGSAASAVAGAVAAHAALGTELSKALTPAGLDPSLPVALLARYHDDLLEAAVEAEAVVAGRHFDNVAPSLLGGAVLVVTQDPPRFTRVRVDAGLALVLVTPGYGVETAAARAVLPAAVPRSDAIAQASSLAALLLGLERGEDQLVRAAMRDRIAEPARASLYPGYAEARTAALAAGALGVVVSGAGPTVVAIVREGAASQATAQALVAGYRSLGIEATAHEARVDETGARVESRG